MAYDVKILDEIAEILKNKTENLQDMMLVLGSLMMSLCTIAKVTPEHYETMMKELVDSYRLSIEVEDDK